MMKQSKGGKARAAKLTPEERSESARNAAKARWGHATRFLIDLPEDDAKLFSALMRVHERESPSQVLMELVRSHVKVCAKCSKEAVA